MSEEGIGRPGIAASPRVRRVINQYLTAACRVPGALLWLVVSYQLRGHVASSSEALRSVAPCVRERSVKGSTDQPHRSTTPTTPP